MSAMRALWEWLRRYWAIIAFILTVSASAFAWGLGVDRQIERNADTIEQCQDDIEDVASCLARISETQAEIRNHVALGRSERHALDGRMEYQTWLLQELYRQVTGRSAPGEAPDGRDD